MTIFRTFRLACGVAALLLATNAASAGEASRVAERGGFLLGHAYRCGIGPDRLQPAARIIEQLIAALAFDGDEKIAADQKLIDQVLVSALAEVSSDPLPSCTAIRHDLALFEQHQRLVSL